jgi:hypothetical protein
LTATGLPAGATVTFSPASVTPGSAGATVTMTVQTTPLSAENSNIAGRSSGDHDLSGDRGSFAYWPVGVPTVAALFALPARVRRPVRSRSRARSRGRGVSFTRRLGLLLVAGAALSLSGCGGGFALPGTTTTSQSQPQTYTITIAGTSGSLQHSTSVQITLQ